MKWEIDWGPVFCEDVKRLHLYAARDLCAEILGFAEVGYARSVRAHPHDRRRLWIVVPGAVGYLFADPETGVLYAHRAFRRS